MAYIYYPTSASLMTRTVSGSTYSEINIGVLPDRIMVFTQEGFTSSFSTASYAFTASHALNATSTSYTIITQSIEYVSSASWASSSISSSYALSASYAPGNGSGISLTTGSTYPITSSWALTSSLAITSSFFNGDYLVDKTGYVGRNLLPDYLWTEGSGSIDIFNFYSHPLHNFREYGVGPFGNRTLLWKAVSGGTQLMGGWQTQNFPVDPNKSYRYSVYLQYPSSSIDAHSSCGFRLGANSNYSLNLNNTTTTSSVFVSKLMSHLVRDRWYLAVGYLWAKNSPQETESGLSGIYDAITGEFLGGAYNKISDFKMSSSYVQSQNVYFAPNNVSGSYFYLWGPRVEEINSNLLPISKLILNSTTSSLAITASYYNQLWLNTGSSYPITSSWSESSSFAISASYAPYQESSSYSTTASYAVNATIDYSKVIAFSIIL